MSDVKSKVVKKDFAVAVDTGNDLAVRLASMKAGESLDVVQTVQPTITTPVARDFGPKPERFYDEGIGAGRAPSGIAQYVTKVVQTPRGLPGHGRTTPGQSTTTSRADSFAIASDYRAAGGTDENGGVSAGPEAKPPPTNPSRLPDVDASGDAGGPVRKGAKRDG
jgi:hypothetical protein